MSSRRERAHHRRGPKDTRRIALDAVRAVLPSRTYASRPSGEWRTELGAARRGKVASVAPAEAPKPKKTKAEPEVTGGRQHRLEPPPSRRSKRSWRGHRTDRSSASWRTDRAACSASCIESGDPCRSRSQTETDRRDAPAWRRLGTSSDATLKVPPPRWRRAAVAVRPQLGRRRSGPAPTTLPRLARAVPAAAGLAYKSLASSIGQPLPAVASSTSLRPARAAAPFRLQRAPPTASSREAGRPTNGSRRCLVRPPRWGRRRFGAAAIAGRSTARRTTVPRQRLRPLVLPSKSPSTSAGQAPMIETERDRYAVQARINAAGLDGLWARLSRIRMTAGAGLVQGPDRTFTVIRTAGVFAESEELELAQEPVRPVGSR